MTHFHLTAADVAEIAADMAALAALLTVIYARATLRDARLDKRYRALQDAARLVEETRAAAEASRLGTAPDNAWIGPRDMLRQALISMPRLFPGVELMAWAGTRQQVEALAEKARLDLWKALIEADLAQRGRWARVQLWWGERVLHRVSRKVERDVLRRNPPDS